MTWVRINASIVKINVNRLNFLLLEKYFRILLKNKQKILFLSVILTTGDTKS